MFFVSPITNHAFFAEGFACVVFLARCTYAANFGGGLLPTQAVRRCSIIAAGATSLVRGGQAYFSRNLCRKRPSYLCTSAAKGIAVCAGFFLGCLEGAQGNGHAEHEAPVKTSRRYCIKYLSHCTGFFSCSTTHTRRPMAFFLAFTAMICFVRCQLVVGNGQ